jgi:hypothetical protein
MGVAARYHGPRTASHNLARGRRAAGVWSGSDVAVALSEAVIKLVENPDRRRRAWLQFTDDVSLPDGTDDIAELAFEAGYATP